MKVNLPARHAGKRTYQVIGWVGCLLAAVSLSLASDWMSAWPKTNFNKRIVDLSSIKSGGPPRDGIPPIDQPRFVTLEEASGWIGEKEPVLFLHLGDDKRVYPLQILIWHEIVNDMVNGMPVSVTFCPLCYSGIAFDRRLGDRVFDFGTSGLLRHSDLVMYDRQTESLWQQLTGEAIVGDMVGSSLQMIPISLISFGQVKAQHSGVQVLSKLTGYVRKYGENPYAGYDDITKVPIFYKGPLDKVKPMEHLATVLLGEEAVGYPFSVLKKRRVVQDEIAGTQVVVFYEKSTGTALDQPQVDGGRSIGAANVFKREVEGRTLNFERKGDNFVDKETRSTWNIFGAATAGPLKGKQLEQVVSGNFFAFAWMAFRPETRLYSD